MDHHPYTNHSMAEMIAKHLAERPEDANNPRFLKLKLAAQQPSASPDSGGHSDIAFPGLINPPGVYASNECLIRWRDETILPYLDTHPIWPILLRRVEMILEWRAAVPPIFVSGAPPRKKNTGCFYAKRPAMGLALMRPGNDPR